MNNIVLSTRNIDDFINDLANEVVKRIEQKNTQFKNENSQNDELLTIDEAAKFLNLTVSTIYSKKCKGELPSCKAPGSKKLFFLKKDLVDFMKTGRVKSNFEIEKEASAYISKQKKGLNNDK